MKLVRIIASLTLAATAIATGYAQAQPSGQAGVKPVTAAPAMAASLTNAEVLKVYPKEKRVLLKHGPIPNIGMGAMTMEFALLDPKMLSSVKPGDKVRFAADQVKGEYVVTHIELAK
ncbi:copper-binding protein [Polaromonas jejuensis]|uniref:Copper-binding protein n=1 Tax=Polaromonas jejuensis TaxID=457502 RepID=A0ABW0QD93_9BURK|nr:copper-binding protein [Polaromonas jejuensis]